MPRTFGLIPAAGKSRRMGRPKLGLPLGNRTVLEAVVSAMTQGGVEATLVVLGPTERALKSLAEAADASVLQLDQDTAEMRDTIECGLDWIEERFQPAPSDGWLLLPADHPCVEPQTVIQILDTVAELTEAGSASIIVPVFDNRRGHPVWIAWRHVDGIRKLLRGVGLNTYFRQHESDVLEIPARSASVLWDLDTPEDYERMHKN